jgi:hypothetical protein
MRDIEVALLVGAGFLLFASDARAAAPSRLPKAPPVGSGALDNKWLPVLRGGIVMPDLLALWEPHTTPPEQGEPDHYDSDWMSWAWLVNGRVSFRPNSAPDVYVATREELGR